MPDDIKEPSIGISYQIELIGKRMLVLQSFIDRDCSKDALNAILDKLRNASERQYAYGQIEQIRLDIERTQIEAKVQQGRIEKADEQIKLEWSKGNRRGDPQLTQSQIQKQREAYQVAEDLNDRIGSLRKAQAEWESKLASL